MVGPRVRVTIRHRVEGDRNPAGEAEETWPPVPGEVYIEAGIQPLRTQDRAAISGPGEIAKSSNKAFLPRDTDIDAGDRLVCPDGNYYVVHSVSPWPSHTEAIISVSNKKKESD